MTCKPGKFCRAVSLAGFAELCHLNFSADIHTLCSPIPGVSPSAEFS